jgi:pimeloyl-ACP methyl ester carboxylesterase
MLRPIGVRVGFFLAVILTAVSLSAQRYSDFTIPRPLPPNSYLVIGMLGGVEHWNASNRPVRQLAMNLRDRNLPHVYAETLEHQHKGLAVRLICDAIDANHDGKLEANEKSSARIILYGHSMGAASVVSLAKRLNKLGIPVLLTVQVDSIGQGAGVIPPNVARAANFYQTDAVFLHGREQIRAEDPAKTRIVGNFRYDYKDKDVDLSKITLPERIAGGAHTKMEFDPAVWSEVEKLILAEIK